MGLVPSRAREVAQVAMTMPGFPEELGPLAVVQTPFVGSDFRIKPKCFGAPAKPPLMGEDGEGIEWMMEKSAAERHGLDIGSRFRLEGVFSPRSPITLKAEARRAMRIPEDARSFVFSYPVEVWSSLVHGETTPVGSFLSVGGFVYLDREYNILGATTLMALTHAAPAKQLHFSRPRLWNPEWTVALKEQKRFKLVTIKAMADLGARYFCWLRPGEIFLKADRQPEVPHGGLVYLFHRDLDQSHGLDRYFAVRLEHDVSEEQGLTLLCSKGPPKASVPFQLKDQSQSFDDVLIQG